ncbi:hypothetical protein A2U01_0057672, partial [Trifolium medium]|nr:hypothetical protein [Trifolium medium]
SASESGLQYPPAEGIADSRKGVGPELCTPILQPSVVEKTEVTPHLSIMPCDSCARPSPSRSLKTDGAGGSVVEPDAAVADPEEVEVVLLLPMLPVDLFVLS